MAKPFSSGMFDPAQYRTPDYLPDAQPTIDPGILAQAIKKPGFFDGGGTGSKIGSFILEALTGVPSGAHRQQRLDREMQEYGQKSMLQQQIAMQRQAQEQAYKTAHPDPTNTQRTYEYLKTVMPGVADSYLQSVGMGPPVAVDGVDADGNQTRTLMPRSQVYGGAPQPRKFSALPPGAVPLGGAAPQAPTPFPTSTRRPAR